MCFGPFWLFHMKILVKLQDKIDHGSKLIVWEVFLVKLPIENEFNFLLVSSFPIHITITVSNILIKPVIKTRYTRQAGVFNSLENFKFFGHRNVWNIEKSHFHSWIFFLPSWDSETLDNVRIEERRKFVLIPNIYIFKISKLIRLWASIFIIL